MTALDLSDADIAAVKRSTLKLCTLLQVLGGKEASETFMDVQLMAELVKRAEAAKKAEGV